MATKTALKRRGEKLRGDNDIQGAIAAYREACRLDPADVEAWTACGDLCAAAGAYDDASGCYRRALQLDPGRGALHHNLGVVCEALGRTDEAARCYTRAAELLADPAESHYRLGRLRARRGRVDPAAAALEAAVRARDDHALAHYHLGNLCALQSRTARAARHYDRACALDPALSRARWNRLRLLPVICDTEAEIDAARERFAEGLETLDRELALDTAEQRRLALSGLSAGNNFYLQYQGRDDRALQERFGRIVERVMGACFPQWTGPRRAPAPDADGRIRVGFASACLRYHNGALWLLGWLRHLDRTRFAVHCYHTSPHADASTEAFRRESDVFHHVPGDIEAACERIAGDDLHVLVYPELGMDGPSVAMAGLRLAPVQCVGWGHPITSGLTTMDYWLSSDLMEPDDGQAHYSETLVRLPNLAHVYSTAQRDRLAQRPPVRRRADLGLDDDRVLYLCTQSLFKYLPRYDHLFPEIARRVPKAQFVFLAISSEHVVSAFMRRIDRAFAAAGLRAQDFCRMLPRLPPDDYVELNRLGDVFLDNPPWSGNNTAMTAVDCALPIVTMPTAFMRGRHAYGILRMLGIESTIARTPDEYVELAARLGNDPALREDARREIRERRERVYEDVECVGGLERVLINAAGRRNREG